MGSGGITICAVPSVQGGYSLRTPFAAPLILTKARRVVSAWSSVTTRLLSTSNVSHVFFLSVGPRPAQGLWRKPYYLLPYSQQA